MIKSIINNITWFICKLFKVKENRVLVISYSGKNYTDSPAIIANELKKQNKKIEIISLVSDVENEKKLNKDIIFKKYNYINRAYYHSTSKIWIDNSRKSHFLKKRKNQIYIQTWHAGLGFKKVEKDVQNSLSDDYIKWAKNDSKCTDLMISDGSFLTNVYKSSFWYDGDIWEIGLPRHDAYFNSEIINEAYKNVRSNFNINKDTKILLYAPTFRKDYNLDVYDIDYSSLIISLKKRFGGEWKILIRLHPNLSEISKNLVLPQGVMNVTDYGNGEELQFASDILISDYSSISFDFSMLNRPCFLYANDIEDYKLERGFHFNVEKLHFPLAKNNDELKYIIENFDDNLYYKNLEGFFKVNQIIKNKNSAKDIAKWINQKYFKEKN